MEHRKPTDSTIYKLFASSRHCAFPGCTEPHIEVDENTGVKICNSEVCHIRARRENGPRWDASQSEKDNRGDGNLVLLCRKHHAVVDDRRNEKYYTPDMLKAWKAEQEGQNDSPLAPDDMEAIAETNVIITAETVNLGGEGGAAIGAGGGGGPAIGANAQGGRGGDGGRVTTDGRLGDNSELVTVNLDGEDGAAPGAGGGGGGAVIWANAQGDRGGDGGRVTTDGRLADNSELMTVNLGGKGGAAPGAGGGGGAAIGANAQGGRGGDGGDIHSFTHTLDKGSCSRIVVGQNAGLPEEIGGSTYIEKIAPDGSSEMITPKARAGLSGDSYLPEDVPEIDAAAISRGVRVCCLTVVEGVTIENGTHAVSRFALSAWNVCDLPAEIVFNVLTAVTKRPDEKIGYFVSLLFDGEEKARIAVGAYGCEDGLMTHSFCIPIGACFETAGICKIIAHASGISLCETAIDIRRV